MNRVVLYFGSFNPIHKGHLSIADYVIDSGLCDEMWLVVSPNNPLKKKVDLLDEDKRLEMAKLAVSEWRNDIKICDIEYHLSKPSFTIHTILELSKRYPNIEFHLLMGEDNIFTFDKWHQWIELARKVNILIYPRCVNNINVRKKIEALTKIGNFVKSKFLYLEEAPLIDISSTEIRHKLLMKEDISGYTAKSVIEYINNNKLYKNGSRTSNIK